MTPRTILSSLCLLPFAACAAENPAGDSAQTGGTGQAGSMLGAGAMGGASAGAGGSNPSAAGTTVMGTGGTTGGTGMTGGASSATGGTGMTGGAAPMNGGAPSIAGMPGSGGAMMGSGGMGTTAGAPAGGSPQMGGAGGSGGNPPLNPEDELPGSACTKTFTAPAFSALPTNAKMPDPFTFLDGTKVMTKEDWVCRQKEISVLAQAFIYGPKPGKPETLNATFSNGTLTLEMANAGKTWTLSVNITTPSGTGPFPAMFAVDGGGGPTGVGSIATSLSWLTSNVAAAGSGRGTSGKFYDFFPDSKKTGSLMAWAWAASRIVDGLKATTGHNIDTTKLYGLGCSRNGKTSATMALFDQRIAMVSMLSPGSGTTSGWRPADAQTGSVQTADQIYDETTWMGEDFGQFGNAVNKLPVDQHTVLALAWPRPILVREGTMDSWNCPVCVYTTLKYTQLIYEALGNKDAVGFTHYDGGHCASGGQDWTDNYNAFIKRYISPADGTTSTAGFFDEKFTFDKAKWQDGELTPIP